MLHLVLLRLGRSKSLCCSHTRSGEWFLEHLGSVVLQLLNALLENIKELAHLILLGSCTIFKPLFIMVKNYRFLRFLNADVIIIIMYLYILFTSGLEQPLLVRFNLFVFALHLFVVEVVDHFFYLPLIKLALVLHQQLMQKQRHVGPPIIHCWLRSARVWVYNGRFLDLQLLGGSIFLQKFLDFAGQLIHWFLIFPTFWLRILFRYFFRNFGCIFKIFSFWPGFGRIWRILTNCKNLIFKLFLLQSLDFSMLILNNLQKLLVMCFTFSKTLGQFLCLFLTFLQCHFQGPFSSPRI